jgi:predicted nicotinamide N-methyase
MPSMMRTFEISVAEGETAMIQLHEPSLTSDNLGLKTWTSSVLLSRRLTALQQLLAQPLARVLELGAGTGLVGIAAACAWATNVTLTDLPEILPNLQRNIDNSRKMIEARGGSACALPLDWSDVKNSPVNKDDRFSVILAADPLYSPDHPQMLVDTVHRWLQQTSQARFIVELPLREGYHQERESLKTKLGEICLEIAEEGYEFGQEDWQGTLGEQIEVECWWALWKYKAST